MVHRPYGGGRTGGAVCSGGGVSAVYSVLQAIYT